MTMFTRKAKVELTEEQKEAIRIEKDLKKINIKKKAAKVGKDLLKVGSGILIGIGGTIAYQKFSSNAETGEEDMDTEINDVFEEDETGVA